MLDSARESHTDPQMQIRPHGLGAIGLWKLVTLRQAEPDQGEFTTAPGAQVIATVASTTIANGGDNIGVYTPIFASHSGFENGLLILVFTAMTALWCFAAYWLTEHRALGAPIRRYGHYLLPFVLIALGVLIVHDAGTFELLRSATGSQ